MQILAFAFHHIVLLTLYGVFGMTLFPEALRRTGNKNTLFLLAPLTGACVWLALTVGSGLVLPYNAIYLGAMFLLAALWVVLRRETLFLPEDPRIWFLIAAVVLPATVMSRGIAPTEMDGGLYFTSCIYDHIKCAIINSISAHGLPPVNPWLADGGTPLALVYYFGWHAWAAQLPVLTGCDAFFAECVMTGFTYAVVLTACAGLLTGIGNGRFCIAGTVALLVLCFFDIEYTEIAAKILPGSWMPFFQSPKISGFWNMYDDFLWSPQHMFAAAAVILLLYLYDELLCQENAKTSAAYASLIGLCAAAAVFTSVYAGIFSLILVAAIKICDYIRKRDFRRRFNRAFGWQAAAVFICLLLTAMYLKFLFSYPPEEKPVGFGMMPCFGEIRHCWQYPLYFLQFYFCILPMRWGLIYVFGMIAVLTPGVLPEHPLTEFGKKWILAALLIIFFVHSTFYSNDFGWRFVAGAQLLLAVFSVFTVKMLYRRLLGRLRKRWIVCAVAAPFVFLFFWASHWYSGFYFAPLKYDAALHRTFARAVPGWKVVQAHTGKDDLVLCNPAGFYKLGKLAASSESTNVFFSLFAERDTPIADLIFSKCYSEFFPQKKLEALHQRCVAIFAGAPSQADADYLADTLKVRALIVTPLDGLWKNPGKIENRFPQKVETENYRVYWIE